MEFTRCNESIYAVMDYKNIWWAGFSQQGIDVDLVGAYPCEIDLWASFTYELLFSSIKVSRKKKVKVKPLNTEDSLTMA